MCPRRRNKGIEQCHSLPCGGHGGVMKTIGKIHEGGFFWPNLYKDVNNFVKSSDACKWTENISRRDELPQTNNLECEVFDVWGIEFMGLLYPLWVITTSLWQSTMSENGLKYLHPLLTITR